MAFDAPPPKTYRGERVDGRCVVTVGQRTLDPRHDLMNHSPDGFEWGYAGSGPAQLALAILADALGDDQRALRNYQRFKFHVIAALPHAPRWAITAHAVRDFVSALETQGTRP